MTLALRAHRLLCRLGLHLPGRWRTRKTKTLINGQWSVCPSCGKETWRPDKPVSLAGRSFDELGLGNKVAKGFPVDALNFPVIDHAPRDGVTHEG